jgi:hypothetical protein
MMREGAKSDICKNRITQGVAEWTAHISQEPSVLGNLLYLQFFTTDKHLQFKDLSYNK